MTAPQSGPSEGKKRKIWAGVGILSAALASAAAMTGQLTTIFGGLSPLLPKGAPRISIVSPSYVQFRPRAQPPVDPSADGADDSWTKSPLTVTIPLSYLDQSKSDTRAVVTSSEVSMILGGKTSTYHSAFIVQFLGDGPCDGDWLCKKGVVAPEGVKFGQATELKEILFLPSVGQGLSWGEFADDVIASSGPSSLTVAISAVIALPDSPPLTISRSCAIDIGAYRKRFQQTFVVGQNPRPVFWQPSCS